jgi:hypothetical protein
LGTFCTGIEQERREYDGNSSMNISWLDLSRESSKEVMQAKPSDEFESSLQEISIATIKIEEEDMFAIIYQGLTGHRAALEKGTGAVHYDARLLADVFVTGGGDV